jgi:recombination protein RecT
MSTTTVKDQLKGTTSKTGAAFPVLLESYKGEIEKALPSHIKADRMVRIALTAFRRNPDLTKCDPRSVFAAVIQAAQLGLEPDTLGRSYLIPYGTECQFIPGWKGLVDLVNRDGNATVWTGAVYAGDFFEYSLGDSPFLKHRPEGEDDPEKILYFYAIGRVKGAEWPNIEVWTANKVRKHRDRWNKVGNKHYSFKNWEMYGRKVVLLQVLKYMPMSPEMVRAVELNDAAEIGSQGLNVKDASKNEWNGPPVIDIETPKDEKKEEKKADKPTPPATITQEQYDELLGALKASTSTCSDKEKKEVMDEGLRLFAVGSLRDIRAERFAEAMTWAKGSVQTTHGDPA